MRTVYTQDDAAELLKTGQAHRQAALVYITPIANGADVQVENATAIPGTIVAVATDGKKVWPLNEAMIAALQKAKRPPVKTKAKDTPAGVPSKK